MPNWCHNTLQIEGSPQDVARWVERGAAWGAGDPEIDDQPLHFEAFYPPPKDAAREGLLDWFSDHWGTKWDACFSRPLIGKKNEVGFYIEEGCATYRFDTAWAPPIYWLEHVSAEWPELKFSLSWGEPGMGFGGRALYINGDTEGIEEGNAEDYLAPDEIWF
jgi:hypothetical protein